MVYRGQVKNGHIMLNGSVRLPEGAHVNVEIVDQGLRITRPERRVALSKFQPIRMPGDSLADELVCDRR